MVSEGQGRIVAVNHQTKMATVLLDNRRTVTATWEDVLPLEVRENQPVQENIYDESSDTEIISATELEKISEPEEFEEIIAEEFVEEKVIPREKNYSEEPRQRVGHYNRKANYNKKFRDKKDENFSDNNKSRKNYKADYKKNRRPRRDGDYKK